MNSKDGTKRGERIALILGATGGIGGETATALARHGWKIKALARNGAPTGDTRGWEWIKGDAMDAATVTAAALGVQAIVHAVNPANYAQWKGTVLTMIDNTIAAAKQSGARIILPGTIYNYGPDAFPVVSEDSLQHDTTAKGMIRIELEKRLEAAAAKSAHSLIVRFGDFFGSKPGHSWFTQGMIKPGKPVTSMMLVGKKGVGHDWAYLPDAAETIARLMDREDELEPFARFHFRGHWDADGTEIISAISHVSGRKIKTKTFPWWLFRLLSTFVPLMREMYAVRPLWDNPVELNNAKLVAFLGKEPHTPWNEAMKTTLAGIGSL